MEPLEDRELDALLREWRAPEPPPGLRQTLFPARPWWRRIWAVQIRIPLPVAVCLAVLLALGLWRWAAPRRPAATAAEPARLVTFRELQPVKELKPRIIRSSHETR